MIGCGADHEHDAVRPQQPGELGRIARREDGAERVETARAQWQLGPGVGDHRADPRMGAGRSSTRRHGQVEGYPDRRSGLRGRIQGVRQVVTGAGADVQEPGSGAFGHRLTQHPGDPLGERTVMAPAEEPVARGHHLGGVGVQPSAAVRTDQIEVALPGHVETVPLTAAADPVVLLQGQR